MGNEKMIRTVNTILALCFMILLGGINNSYSQDNGYKWVGTWSTAEQLVEPHNNPPSPGLSNNTLRQIVRVSIGGDTLRLKLSNEFSSSPVTVKEVHFAISTDNGKIDSNSDIILSFGGSTEYTMEAGGTVTSDPFAFNLLQRTDYAITIFFGETSNDVTGHPGSRTTSYILSGNEANNDDFSSAVKTDHWYVINTIDVMAPDTSAAIVVIGNSITDGRGSGTNEQNRWPDVLSERLLANFETEHISMLNQGIGGNCVLKACLGPSAISRLSRDVFGQSGVRWLIIFEGVNDIGGAVGAADADKVADGLIAAYEEMIDSAHTRGIFVYGATIMPFGESFYYSDDRESARQKVNSWIRHSGLFDAVIDIDEALRDPNNPIMLKPEADDGDHLHPSKEGHRMIAESVDLNLFTQSVPFENNIPFVYEVENTGSEFDKPTMPSMPELPIIEPLTDPFEWSDGSGRSTKFEDWKKRRSEIKAEIEHYEIGLKPDRPDSITANYSNGTLTVNVINNNKTLILTSQVLLPEGEGPFPAVIGMAFFPGGGGTGSLPSDIFSNRDIARIEFVHDQVTTYGSQQTSDPYYQLHPELDDRNTGQYSAWAWGVSRLIDGLELVKDDLPIDLEHLAVTGCSYAGKMALFAGAFDERIALTIAQESGGGGAPAWRVSETLGDVERLHSTDHNWFKESMFQFGHSNVAKLPEDHHELMAMCAPRALLVTGNTNYKWLANPSCYISARAAHRVYKTFGIGERFGFFIDGGHDHCSIPNSQRPAIEAFIDAFLLGDSTVNTNISTHPYPNEDYRRWTEWWGTGNPILPGNPSNSSEIYYYEPECGEVGSNWNIISNPRTSGGKYVTVPENESVSEAPTTSEDHIKITFTVENDTTFYVYGLMDCPTADDDSYWLKIDDGTFSMVNGLVTSGWEWTRMTSYNLTSGEHILTIAYRENGTKLDKICISDYSDAPEGLGGPAVNACNTTDINESDDTPGTYGLEQNYPNPFNPITKINYSIPKRSRVSIKVYDLLGKEVATLYEGIKKRGNHSVIFDGSDFTSGVYFYKLQTEKFFIAKKLVLLK